jgi:hypothetical protein
MRKIATIEGYDVYWIPPEYDGGTGSGTVDVNGEVAGTARTEPEAKELARRHIERWKR